MADRFKPGDRVVINLSHLGGMSYQLVVVVKKDPKWSKGTRYLVEPVDPMRAREYRYELLSVDEAFLIPEAEWKLLKSLKGVSDDP